MMKEKVVSISSSGAGWIDITFCLNGRKFSLGGISYIANAIGDLARFGLQIATGSEHTTVSFDREPAEWRLVAQSLLEESTGKGPVQISAYEFANMQIDAPLSEGHLVFCDDFGALDFSRAILIETTRFLAETDDDLWSNRTPAAAIAALEAALAVYN